MCVIVAVEVSIALYCSGPPEECDPQQTPLKSLLPVDLFQNSLSAGRSLLEQIPSSESLLEETWPRRDYILKQSH